MTEVLIFAGIVGAANVLGGLVVIRRLRESPRVLHVLVAFGAGFMLAVALLEMVPASMSVGGGLTAVLIGYLAVHFNGRAHV